MFLKKLLVFLILLKSTTLLSQYDSSSYYLSTKSTTSAGVYKSGRLIRTLWSNVEKPAGTFQFTWDRKNDSNQSITPPYGIKVVANNLKYRWSANIGNTSRDSVGSNKIRALRTPTDGVEVGNFIYFSTGFVEGNTSTFKIAKNDLKRMIPVRPSQCGDADGEIRFCATDSNLVYWAGLDAWARAWPATNKTAPDTNSWVDCFIYATRVSNDNDYTFSSGVTLKPSLAQCRTYSAIGVTLKDTAAKPTGLAVMKTGNYLYLTQLGKGLVKCYNKTTGALVQTISLSLGDICIKDSIVYGIVGNSVRGYKINSNGTLSSTSFNVSITKPINISCGNLIYVTVASTQQIKAYNTSGTLQWTYGQSGGYKSSPYVTNDKFHFVDYNDLVSKGFTFPCLDGSFWISDAGNARQLRISSNRTYLEGFSYLPMNYNASASNKRVFAGFMEFNTDSNKLVANWSGNLKSGYLNIHRRDILSDIFVSNNRTFATIHYYPNGIYDDGGRTPEYVELTDTGIRYTGIRISPNTNRWFINSTTPNGDRFRYEYTESTSGVDTVHKRTFTGLNGSGNPTWGSESVFALVPITPNSPIRYCGEKINSNLVFFSANWANTGYHLGRVVNNKWVWMTSPSTTRTYTGPMPTSDSFDCGNGVEYAGGRCYNVDSFYAWNYIGEFWKNSQTNVWKLFSQDGLMLYQFGKTGPQSASISGTYDAPIEAAGNGFSGQMVKKSNGNLAVYYNDESRHGAIGSFEISGLNTIRTLYPVTYLAIGDKASVKCVDGKIVFDIPYENKAEYSIDNGKTWLRLNIKNVDIYDNCLYKISKIRESKVVGVEILNQPNCFDFKSIKIYPNPFSQSIIIESDFEYYRMIIRNQVGKIVIDKMIENVGCSYEESTVSNLPKGFYFIQIISDDLVFTKKLIKS
jgi:hypothetical protein